MNCPHCGTENDNFQTICMSCGEPLTPGLFSCPICGKVLKVEDTVCPRCKTKIYEHVSNEEKEATKWLFGTTPKFIGSAPAAFAINIVLFILQLSFMVTYIVLNYGNIHNLSFNIVGLSIALLIAFISLMTRGMLNTTGDPDKLEKRLSLIKATTATSIISDLYVFLFVILPEYLTNTKFVTYFKIYFLFYIVATTLCFALVPILFKKARIRTR